MKKKILIPVILLLLGVFLYSAWNVVGTLLEYREGQNFYENLEQYVDTPNQESNAAKKSKLPLLFQTKGPTVPVLSETDDYPQINVDFDALREINDDVVGWVYIPDTEINYPVLQGEDNDQYLYHLLTGAYNGSGSIFLDAGVASDFSGKNSPVYGHNMKNGSMFAGLMDYKSQEFFDQHPKAYLMTPEKNYVVHLFSGYVIDTWSNAWDMVFADGKFGEWLRDLQSRSCFSSTVIPEEDDCVLTLSTCSYEVTEGRFVVHGILEEYTADKQDTAD